MLKKLVSRNQKDWDDCLPYLLFAYCKVPQESTSFSPFELLYRRRVRGPRSELGTRLKRKKHPYCGNEGPAGGDMWLTAGEHGESSAMAESYDRGPKEQEFEVSDGVLVLLPMQHNRLNLEWDGPYTVVRKVNS